MPVAALATLAVLLVASILPPGGSFIDDDGSVHEGSIEAIAAAGITLGCNPPANNRYCPEQPVSRGQMAAFISRALDLAATDIDHFADEDGHLFENAANRLADAGITRGCNPPLNDRFCPERLMTRGEMAAMLSRAFGYRGEDDDYFGDDEGNVFERDINRLAAAGVTLGCNPPANDRFCPQDRVTRGEMATFLTRALQLTPEVPPRRLNAIVPIEPRREWGALSALPHLMAPHTVERLTIHHAGTQSGTTGPAQFRGWQSWHMDGQGWGDIAYHLIIGIDGTVYEGRDPAYRGDTGTTYDTTGHFLVVVEGNFDTDRPTDAQIESLIAVLAGAAVDYEVSPATISGHRDHAATTCPGHNLAAMIHSGEIQQAVENRIDQGVELVWP